MVHFGNWLKARREKLGFLKQELADKVGVRVRTISYWEAAEQMPGMYNSNRQKLAAALGLSVLELEAIGAGLASDMLVGAVNEGGKPAEGGDQAPILPSSDEVHRKNVAIAISYIRHFLNADPGASKSIQFHWDPKAERALLFECWR